MSFIPAVVAGLGALGGLFGSKSKQQQSGQQTTQQTGYNAFGTGTSGASSSNPLLNPLAGAGYSQIAQNYMDLLTKDPNLSGYQAQQSGQINRLADIQRQNTQENLAARGITGPAAATATGNVESQRIAQQAGLSQQIPLLARQLQETTLGNAGNFFSRIPVGTYNENFQNTQGNSTFGNFGATQQQGTVINSQNPLAGLFGGAGNILALLSGMGAFGGGRGGSGNTQSLGY